MVALAADTYVEVIAALDEVLGVSGVQLERLQQALEIDKQKVVKIRAQNLPRHCRESRERRPHFIFGGKTIIAANSISRRLRLIRSALLH